MAGARATLKSSVNGSSLFSRIWGGTNMEPTTGDIVHFEVNTTNPQRAKKFYSSVLGWKYKDSSMPGIEYYLIDGITPAGGINPLTEPSKTKSITVYFGTDDIDSTIKKIKDGRAKSADPRPGLVRRMHGPGREHVLAIPERSKRDGGADAGVRGSPRLAELAQCPAQRSRETPRVRIDDARIGSRDRADAAPELRGVTQLPGRSAIAPRLEVRVAQRQDRTIVQRVLGRGCHEAQRDREREERVRDARIAPVEHHRAPVANEDVP